MTAVAQRTASPDRSGAVDTGDRSALRRLAGALLRRECGRAFVIAVLAATVFGGYVAHAAAAAGLFSEAGARTLAASPLLARLVALPAAMAGAVMVGAALLAIVRVAEDRQRGWLIPLAAESGVRAAYPLALASAVIVPLAGVYLAAVAGFTGVRMMVADGSPDLGIEALRFAVLLAACFAAVSYGALLSALLREPALALITAGALYAVPLVPAIVVASGGGEPGAALRLLALPLPVPSVAADVGVLLSHVRYGAVVMAGLVAFGGRLFGRPR